MKAAGPMFAQSVPLRRMLREDAWPIAALVLLALVAWVWTLHLVAGMDRVDDMPEMQRMAAPVLAWDWQRALSTFVMWTVMMVAMMLPSALPVLLLLRRVADRDRRRQAAGVPLIALLAAGYLLVWTLYSALATLAQIGLSSVAQITPMMALVDRQFAAAVLIGAGLYQLTPVKQRCLRLCRSPLVFLTQHYRGGRFGALRMGAAHGTFCLGCCWAAMALLFVGGVMNPLWIVGLSIFVLVEKLLPFGGALGMALGAASIAGGVYLLIG